MIELRAKQMPGNDEAMEVTIEFGGKPSDIEEELEAILYHLYKRTWKKVDHDLMKRMCAATRNAMARIVAEVLDDGEL